MSDVSQIATYGHHIKAWERAKEEAIKILVRQRNLVTYSDLAARMRSITFDPHGHDFHALLGQISIDEDAAGRGMLSALVVHKDDGKPGRGFFDLARDLGRDVGDEEMCWAREVDLVLNKADAHPLRK